MKFNFAYFLVFLLLLIIEIAIAVFISDSIIRPFVGDFLVVIMIYCLIRSFAAPGLYVTLTIVLLFAYLIETLQYFQFVYRIGLGGSAIARTMIGTYFAWMDILMYTLGILLVLVLEKRTFLMDKILK